MRKVVFFQSLLLVACSFTSCVDSNYNLSDVDTDDIVIGEEWVAPLGTGSVKAKDLVNTGKVSSIIVENGGYVALYKGSLKIDKLPEGLRANDVIMEVATEEIITDELSKLFDGQFKLGLTDPHIKLETNLSEGSVDCRLDLTSTSDVGEAKTSDAFTFSANHNKVWIGPLSTSVTPGFDFIKEPGLPGLLLNVPKKLKLSLFANVAQLLELSPDAMDELGYTLEIPFIPSKEFYAESSERIEDAFDESFVDYVFSGGSATIYGEVVNGMPFDILLNMTILDQQDQPLDITFPAQAVTGKEGKVEFTIQEKDMHKMEHARHIKLNVTMSGREQPEILKESDEVSLKLKLRKKGGISI